jgi:glycosyltransferase involved in cell wall biosynthesis
MEFMLRLLYPRAHAVVGVSDAVVEDLVRTYKIPRRKVHRIYNPVNEDFIQQSAVMPPPHPWLDPTRTFTTLVCVAALKESKGHTYLIEAMRLLPIDQYRLLLVGDGPLQSQLERKVQALKLSDRVMFLGYNSNPYPFIRYADALVLPSLWEGFGLAAVEAAVLGVPVVASKVGGLRELVPKVVEGCSVTPADPVALAEAIKGTVHAAHDVRHGRVHAPPARTISMDQFDIRYVAACYLNLLEMKSDALLCDGFYS